MPYLPVHFPHEDILLENLNKNDFPFYFIFQKYASSNTFSPVDIAGFEKNLIRSYKLKYAREDA